MNGTVTLITPGKLQPLGVNMGINNIGSNCRIHIMTGIKTMCKAQHVEAFTLLEKLSVCYGDKR